MSQPGENKWRRIVSVLGGVPDSSVQAILIKFTNNTIIIW